MTRSSRIYTPRTLLLPFFSSLFVFLFFFFTLLHPSFSRHFSGVAAVESSAPSCDQRAWCCRFSQSWSSVECALSFVSLSPNPPCVFPLASHHFWHCQVQSSGDREKIKNTVRIKQHKLQAKFYYYTTWLSFDSPSFADGSDGDRLAACRIIFRSGCFDLCRWPIISFQVLRFKVTKSAVTLPAAGRFETDFFAVKKSGKKGRLTSSSQRNSYALLAFGSVSHCHRYLLIRPFFGSKRIFLFFLAGGVYLVQLKFCCYSVWKEKEIRTLLHILYGLSMTCERFRLMFDSFLLLKPFVDSVAMIVLLLPPAPAIPYFKKSGSIQAESNTVY